jgi:CheY-like chemotaxis protein
MLKKILLFDSLQLTQMRLTYALQGVELSIQQVSSLEEAMRSALASIKPHAMLINAQLKGLEGTEIARAFKSSSDFPILMYSIEPPENIKKIAEEINADGYFSLLSSDKDIVHEILRVTEQQKVEASKLPEVIPSRFLDAVSDLLPNHERNAKPASPAQSNTDSTMTSRLSSPHPIRALTSVPAAISMNRSAQVFKLAPAPALKRSIVLLIDDEPGQLLFQRLLLSGQSLRLIEGHSGLEALSLAKEHLPDLIVLDFMMPGIDGLEVISRLRKDPLTAAVPVLLTVTQVEVSYVSQRQEVLQFDILVKPIDQDDLQKKVHASLVL